MSKEFAYSMLLQGVLTFWVLGAMIGSGFEFTIGVAIMWGVAALLIIFGLVVIHYAYKPKQKPATVQDWKNLHDEFGLLNAPSLKADFRMLGTSQFPFDWTIYPHGRAQQRFDAIARIGGKLLKRSPFFLAESARISDLETWLNAVKDHVGYEDGPSTTLITTSDMIPVITGTIDDLNQASISLCIECMARMQR